MRRAQALLDRASILLAGRGAVRVPAQDPLPSSFTQGLLDGLPHLDTLLEYLTEVPFLVTVPCTVCVDSWLWLWFPQPPSVIVMVAFTSNRSSMVQNYFY